jgi:hypothetical protein
LSQYVLYHRPLPHTHTKPYYDHNSKPLRHYTSRFPSLCCRQTPHAVLNSLVLLTMGIMMPETCWESIDHE